MNRRPWWMGKDNDLKKGDQLNKAAKQKQQAIDELENVRLATLLGHKPKEDKYGNVCWKVNGHEYCGMAPDYKTSVDALLAECKRLGVRLSLEHWTAAEGNPRHWYWQSRIIAKRGSIQVGTSREFKDPAHALFAALDKYLKANPVVKKTEKV